MKSIAILTALLLAPLAALHAVAAPISITDMRTEGASQPMGVEESAPRFSWRYESAAQSPRGFRQSGYRIQVASSPEKLTQADMWDSGKLVGSDSLAVLYAGKPLASATRYFWQVTGFDAAGNAYASQPQFFEMGLLKTDDWCGAQWIGAKNERPKTIPANLKNLKDYSFETRFRILEGSATILFRTAYISGGGYGIEIQPGTPGKFIVTCKGPKDKVVTLKEYPLPAINKDEWHALQVTAKGAQFWFRMDDVPINRDPLHDETCTQGTVAMGAFTIEKKKGLVQFDDFKLTVNDQTLVQESFSNPALFAFQDCYFGSVGGTHPKDPVSTSYSLVKDGVLEVRSINTFLDPKEGLAAPMFRKSFSTESKKSRGHGPTWPGLAITHFG